MDREPLSQGQIAAIERSMRSRRAEINTFNVIQFVIAAIAAHASGEISSRALAASAETGPKLALMSLWYAVAIPGIVALCGFLIHRCAAFIEYCATFVPGDQQGTATLSDEWEHWKSSHANNWMVVVGAIAAAVALLYPLRVDLGILWGAGWTTEIVLALLSLAILVVLALAAPWLARLHQGI